MNVLPCLVFIILIVLHLGDAVSLSFLHGCVVGIVVAGRWRSVSVGDIDICVPCNGQHVTVALAMRTSSNSGGGGNLLSRGCCCCCCHCLGIGGVVVVSYACWWWWCWPTLEVLASLPGEVDRKTPVD